MAKKALPKRIYVKRAQDRDAETSWLEADETPNSMEDGDTVGIYELKDTKTLRVTRDLK